MAETAASLLAWCRLGTRFYWICPCRLNKFTGDDDGAWGEIILPWILSLTAGALNWDIHNNGTNTDRRGSAASWISTCCCSSPLKRAVSFETEARWTESELCCGTRITKSRFTAALPRDASPWQRDTSCVALKPLSIHKNAARPEGQDDHYTSHTVCVHSMIMYTVGQRSINKCIYMYHVYFQVKIRKNKKRRKHVRRTGNSWCVLCVLVGLRKECDLTRQQQRHFK